MHADVLPVAAVLVSGPHRRVALRARPAVQREDEGALARALGERLVALAGGVESEGVPVADPLLVGLERADARTGDLCAKVAQVLPGNLWVGRGCDLGLCPEADLHAPLVGIGREGREVVDVGRKGGEALGRALPVRAHAPGHLVAVVAVARAVAVVGEDPAEGHVVLGVLVDDGARGELVGCPPEVLLGRGDEDLVGTVERLGEMALRHHIAATASQLIAHLTRPVRRGRPAHDPLLRPVLGLVRPGVAVVGVEVAEIEGKAREQRGGARRLVVGAQDRAGRRAQVAGIGQEKIRVEHRILVSQDDRGAGARKVVQTGGKRAPQHAVARARPEKRARGRHAAVAPLVAVHGRGHDAHDAARVVDAAVLRAAAEEALSGRRRERLRGAAGAQLERGRLPHDDAPPAPEGQPSVVLVDKNLRVAGAHDERRALVRHACGGVGVDVGLVRLRLDAGHVVRRDRARVRRKGARRVDRHADDVLVEKGDAARQVLLAGAQGDERLAGALGVHTNIYHVPLLC